MEYPQLKIRTSGPVVKARAYVPAAPWGSVFTIFNYLMWVVIETAGGEVIQAYPSALSGTTGWEEQGCLHIRCDGDIVAVPTLGPIAQAAGKIRIVRGDGYTDLSLITIAGQSAVKSSNGVLYRPNPTGGWADGAGDIAGGLSASYCPDGDYPYAYCFGGAWSGSLASPANGTVTLTYKDTAYVKSFFGSGTRMTWTVTCTLSLEGGTPRFILTSRQTRHQYLDNPDNWTAARWYDRPLGSSQYEVTAVGIDLHPSMYSVGDVPSVMGVISDCLDATAEVPSSLEGQANLKALESYREVSSNTTENVTQLAHIQKLLPIEAAYRFATAVSHGVFHVKNLKKAITQSLTTHEGRITAKMLKSSIRDSALLTADSLLACQKLCSSLYLWWRYVANTSVEDAKEWITYLSKSSESGKITVSDWQNEVEHSFRAALPPEVRRLRGSASGDSVVNGQTASHRLAVVAKVQPFEAAEFILKPLRLGLNVGYGTTWDLIPLSFVVDWFTGIGDTLRGVDWLLYRHLLGLQAHIVTIKSVSEPKLPPGWQGTCLISRFSRRVSFEWPSFIDSIPIPRMLPFEKWKYAALALATS